MYAIVNGDFGGTLDAPDAITRNCSINQSISARILRDGIPRIERSLSGQEIDEPQILSPSDDVGLRDSRVCRNAGQC